jgi:hypothetical protein
LNRLARLGYAQISPTHDAKHNGSYSPDLRDRAESARWSIVKALLDSKGIDGWNAKLDLLKVPDLSDYHDRLLAMSIEKAAEELDEVTYSDFEVREFEKSNKLSPKTHEQMFSVLKDRLDEIDDHLLADTSPREMWSKLSEEKILRRAIAEQLKNTSRGSYSVDQEAATADEKETDIRLRTPGNQFEAVIELKVGENGYSINDLIAALREQLVNKYMGSEACRSGCLLISVSTERKWKDPVTHKMIDANAVVQILNNEANKIEIEKAHTLKVFIKLLDLRPRLKKVLKGNRTIGAA